MKTCFIVCPIGNEGSETRNNSDTVLEFIIEPICSELGFKITRVDKLFGVDRIDNTIYQHLTEADLVIADMSEYNPNAFYEMGYRHALGKPLIPIMKEGTNIPFDLATLRTINYATDNLKKAEEAKKRLKETILSFDYSVEDKDIESQPETHQTNLVPHLLKIQDEIIELKSIMLTRNNEVAATAVDLAVSQIQKNNISPQDKAIDSFLSLLMNDPSKADGIIEMAKKFEDLK